MASPVTAKLTWDDVICYVCSIFSYFQLNEDIQSRCSHFPYLTFVFSEYLSLTHFSKLFPLSK